MSCDGNCSCGTDNKKVIVKYIKLRDDAIEPLYSSKQAAGADVFANISDRMMITGGKHAVIPTGISVEIPEGYEIQVRSRSGLAAKNCVFVLNSPGTIDSDYRGEICVILANFGDNNFIVEKNMRIAQLVLNKVDTIEFKEVTDLTDTTRGIGGLGSTGLV